MPNKLCYNKNASTTEKGHTNFASGGTYYAGKHPIG